MAGLGAKDILRNVTALEQLIEEINFQRAKEMRQCLMSKDSDTGFVMVQGTTYWTDLFVRHFLFQTDRSTDADDLLFFIRKKHLKGSRYIPKYQTEVEVYRRDSRKLPIGDPDVDWEETVYLNLIIHQFDYTLTLAVCTRTSPKDLQVLRRHSQKVYASPSRRRMDTKGEVEEITYPSVCFHVDNFDEVFADMLVRDGEMVCVELVAADHAGTRQAVIFLGSIRYDALKRVYDARASLSSKVAQRMMMGLFAGNSNQRIEFVRMKGPQGKGHAEMAVTKPKGSGVETPTSEPGVSLTDMWDCDWEDEPEDRFIYRHQRRLSDPSANFNTFINSGWKSRPEGARSRSENEGLDYFADGLYEIESGDVRDAVCSGRCCSVVACNTIHEEEETPQSVQCAKCRHFHGDQPVSSHSNLPSPSLVATQNPSWSVDQTEQNLDIPGAIPSRPQSPEEDSPLLCPSQPSPPLIPRGTHPTQAITRVQTKPQSASEPPPTVLSTSKSPPTVLPTCVPKCDLDQRTVNPTNTPIIPDEPNSRGFKRPGDSPQTHTVLNEPHSKDIELAVVASEEQEILVLIEDQATRPCGSREINETTFICQDIQSQIVKANQSQSPTQSCSSLQIQGLSPPESPSQSQSPSLCPKKVSKVQELPVIAFSSGSKRPGSAQRVHSPSTPETPTKPKNHTESPKGSNEEILPQSPLATPEDFSSPEDDPMASIISRQASKHLSDDEDIENINETSKLLDEPTASTSRVRSNPLSTTCNLDSARDKPQFQKSLSVDSAKVSTRKRDSVDSVESASESLTALNLSPVKKKKKVTVPYRVAPDGTKVNFLCDVKLDDGAYNPLWTTKGFTQTFHFWKESRRAQSVPLNAYLTYVTLPWFTIITDILDHRTGPILTF
ncbi:hypothetical protein Pmani_028095 [Petrolisthes manimaculis]|uniref:Uncharacterized protein n=1 Tax=Petrolisthes manimaculis TaxID=1843537 RepID=A0AAE1P2S9_9EUCA|nr:hypothetical protein Pmani_028095 [Petrolisthes manimaculis]